MSGTATLARESGRAADTSRTVPPLFLPVLEWLEAELSRAVTPLEYHERPFSHVLRAVVRTPIRTGAERRVFVKVFKSTGTVEDIARMRARVARDFEQTREIHRSMSAWPDLCAVQPVACSPGHLAIVTEEAEGTTLLDRLHADASWLRRAPLPPVAFERVGAWLGAFQATGASAGRTSVEALRAYVDLRLARLVRMPAAGMDAEDRRRVLQHIDRLGARVHAADLREVPVHADLAPGNILIAGERVTVLDFAMIGTGSRLHDLTRLFVQIELMALKPHLRTEVLTRANRAILRGFDPEVEPTRPMFRLLSLQHRVNHLATLSKAKHSFPASAYNWHVRRHHRAWISRELRAGGV